MCKRKSLPTFFEKKVGKETLSRGAFIGDKAIATNIGAANLEFEKKVGKETLRKGFYWRQRNRNKHRKCRSGVYKGSAYLFATLPGSPKEDPQRWLSAPLRGAMDRTYLLF